jgi:hypothetical protein
MEEELTAFRVGTANDAKARSTVPAPRATVPAERATVPAPRPSAALPSAESASLPPYTSTEPSSCMRLRVAPFSLMPAAPRRFGNG